MHARYRAINLINVGDETHHFLNIMHKKASFTMYNNFWSGTTSKRDDRTAESHSLDHHHPERLFPLKRVEKTTCTTEQANLLFHIHRPHILHVLIINVWFYLLMKVLNGVLLI